MEFSSTLWPQVVSAACNCREIEELRRELEGQINKAEEARKALQDKITEEKVRNGELDPDEVGRGGYLYFSSDSRQWVPYALAVWALVGSTNRGYTGEACTANAVCKAIAVEGVYRAVGDVAAAPTSNKRRCCVDNVPESWYVAGHWKKFVCYIYNYLGGRSCNNFRLSAPQ